MESMTDILLGKGIKGLPFGLSQDEVRDFFGEPDLVERVDFLEDGTEVTEYWYYEKCGLRASFDQDDDFRLGALGTRSSSYSLEGLSLVGSSHDTVMTELGKLALGSFERNEFSGDEDGDVVQISFEESSLDLWFRDGTLDLLEWGYFWRDEETPLWPAIVED